MARGINKVILIGNLGADPQVRYSQSGVAMTSINLATADSWKDKQTGEQQDRTEWHRLVFFNRLAEIAGEYLRKGSKIYVEGSLRTRKWQDKNGVERYTTEIMVNEMQMLDSRGASAPASAGMSGAGKGKESFEQGQDYGMSEEHSGFDSGHGGQGKDFEDDIPF